MKVAEEEHITVMDGAWSPVEVIREIVGGGAQEDSFYVMDLGEVVSRYRRWKELMPRVAPFYAVKCNNDKLLVTTLAALGAGFDCASKAEIELVTSIGVEPERIIFANPAKMISHIRYASAAGVDCMTFDSEHELTKIKQYMPHAQLVIRIRCDAKFALCPLGIKFGCDPISEAPTLLKLAAEFELEVVGVAFHVGSGIDSSETEVFERGIAHCRALFDLGRSVGHEGMRLVDLGGGFPGASNTDILMMSKVINASLEKHFPHSSVRVTAEPGTYFAAAAFTLAACVYAKRKVILKDAETDELEPHMMYYINDGVYGSFDCAVSLHQAIPAEPLNASAEPSLPCSVWGPTLDSNDCVLPITQLPPLNIGEWLVFKDMGAYTLAIATTFNSIPVPRVRAFIDQDLWSVLKELHPLSSSHSSADTDKTDLAPLHATLKRQVARVTISS